MLGKKKDKKEEDLPEFQQDPTQDAKMQLESTKDLLDFVATEFKGQYAGFFDPKAIEDGTINSESMSLDLLFAIFSELRILRELQSHKKP